MMTEQLSFPMAKPARAGYPQEPIVRSAEIEDNYRWVLKRAWGAGPCILWCGLNPSTADGQRDDFSEDAVFRLGKKHTGRVLFGREHNGCPV